MRRRRRPGGEMAAIGQRARDAAAALASLRPRPRPRRCSAAAAGGSRRRGRDPRRQCPRPRRGRRRGARPGVARPAGARRQAARGDRRRGSRTIAALPDPVGRELARWTRPNGLDIARVAVPLGVIGIIYESRPNVTADAGGLALKSGNAAILRGGSESFYSSRALVGGAGRRAARSRPARGRDPAGADPRPRRGRADARHERGHRHHRAARRPVADRAGAARQPDPGDRPSRRALPHLYRRAPPIPRRRGRSC